MAAFSPYHQQQQQQYHQRYQHRTLATGAEPHGRWLRSGKRHSKSVIPRDSDYTDNVSVRWSHTSTIADQTMYIFGGKKSTGNSESDYASSCLSINLSAKFSTNSIPWEHACENTGPQIAGHSAAINTDINMVVVFGGTMPENADRVSAVHLFSAQIGFWSTPSDREFPNTLIDHTAVIQDPTGDMLIFGGRIVSSDQLSNSTLLMVTDTQRHGYIVSPPPIGFTSIKASSPSASGTNHTLSSTKSTASATTGSAASTALPSASPSSLASGSASVSVSPSVSPSETPSGSLLDTASSVTKESSTTTPKSTSSTKHTSPTTPVSKSSTSAKTTKTTKSTKSTKSTSASTSKPAAKELEERDFVLRQNDDGDDEAELMSWTNDTLPAGVLGRVGHTANIINSIDMVIIGGSDGTKLVNMNVVYVYSTSLRQWSRRTTSGKTPVSRRDHVATVVNQTHIVIHGGANFNFSKAFDDVAVLDTDTWTWTTPNVTNAPAARYAHSASQAGPYMLITFGNILSDSTTLAKDDYGLYILDTSSWQFVTQFEPSRSGLVLHYKNTKLAGATIFGLFVACVAGICVLLILGYVGCMHYYNKHPRLSDSGENTAMLPTTELRSLGRQLTAKFSTQNQRKRQKAEAQSKRLTLGPKLDSTDQLISSDKGFMTQMYPSTPSSPAFSQSNARRTSNAPKSGDDTNTRLMFDLSRDSSLDKSFVAPSKPVSADQRKSPRAEDARLSRRTHLDNVHLPNGLRNRDDLDGGDGVISDNESALDPMANSNGGWSRPMTASSQVSQKSKHISDMLPRIVGSRLTLPAESESALARYRFDELEDNSHTETVPSIPVHILSGISDNKSDKAVSMSNIDMDRLLQPPTMPAAQKNATSQDQPCRSDSLDSLSSTTQRTSTQPTASADTGSNPPNLNMSFRDSIDINAMFSSNHQFFVANPDH
ncbi:hypothetical protein H4R99_006734 [Coemansia sp. RSA 1722]|nr:hypothetical protein H4R99_006734 [Coemansia sp. RSA 1722]